MTTWLCRLAIIRTWCRGGKQRTQWFHSWTRNHSRRPASLSPPSGRWCRFSQPSLGNMTTRTTKAIKWSSVSNAKLRCLQIVVWFLEKGNLKYGILSSPSKSSTTWSLADRLTLPMNSVYNEAANQNNLAMLLPCCTITNCTACTTPPQLYTNNQPHTHVHLSLSTASHHCFLT